MYDFVIPIRVYEGLYRKSTVKTVLVMFKLYMSSIQKSYQIHMFLELSWGTESKYAFSIESGS
jgi:hypothetical protein